MNISRALREIIHKEKMSLGQIVRGIGVDRSSFYRSLRDKGNPERKTIGKLLDHLGYEIQFVKSGRKGLNHGQAFEQREKRNELEKRTVNETPGISSGE